MASFNYMYMQRLVLIALICINYAFSCVVVLKIDPQRSKIQSFVGKVYQEQNGATYPALFINENADYGFQGKLYLQYKGECTNSTEVFVKKLQGAQLVKLESNQASISLYPNQYSVGFYLGTSKNVIIGEFNMTEIGTSLTSKGFKQKSKGKYTSKGDFVFEKGNTFTKSDYIGKDYYLESKVDPTGGKATMTIKASVKGQGVSITIPTLRFRVDLSSDGIDSIDQKGGMIVEVKGSIATSGALGCAVDCGEFGVCQADDNGEPYCECECGYTGEDCLGFSGFCQVFEDRDISLLKRSNSVLEDELETKTTGIEELEQKLKQCTPGVAPQEDGSEPCDDPRRFRNPRTDECDICDSGWSGLAPGTCNYCSSDKACQRVYGDSFKCNQGMVYHPKSQYKEYSCELNDEFVKGLVDQSSVQLRCNTTGAVGGLELPDGAFGRRLKSIKPMSLDSKLNDLLEEMGEGIHGRHLLQGEGKGTCMLEFRTNEWKDKLWQCIGDQCQFTEGASTVGCARSRCICTPDEGSNADCETESHADNKLLGKIEGALILNCNQDTYECSLDLEDLSQIQIRASCQASDCYDENSENLVSQKSIVIQQAAGGEVVLAAIPFIVVFCVFVFSLVFIGYTLLHVPRGQLSSGTALNSGVYGRERHVLSFKKVQVSVQTQGKYQRFFKKFTGKNISRSGTEQSVQLMSIQNGQQGAKYYPASDVADVDGGQFANQRVNSIKKMPSRGQSMRKKELLDAKKIQVDSKGYRQILNKVSGSVSTGEILGVLGPSGSGKSTLLGILTGGSSDLPSSAKLAGSMYVNGVRADAKYPDLVSFVPQAEYLIPTLTVRECVWYSAMLRLPKTVSNQAISQHVDHVIHDINLATVADSLVGGSGSIRGISGGERRRVSIAMELVTQPTILILDEPTSGLDSYTAQKLMCELKEVAKGGRIVIAAMHQPSPTLFDMLDKIMLLALGNMVYYGTPASARDYFEYHGFACPDATAIAEHMLEVAGNTDDLQAILRSQASKPHRYDAIEVSGEAGQSGGHMANVQAPREHKQFLYHWRGWHTKSIRREWLVLFWRTFTDIYRNPTLLLMHVLLALLLGLFLGGIYYNVQNDFQGAQSRLGGIFFTLIFIGLSSTTTIDMLLLNRMVFKREVKARYHGSLSYILSAVLLDGVLLRALPATFLSLPFYFLMGLRPGASHVLTFFFTISTFSCTVGVISLALTTLSGTAGIAALLQLLFNLFGMLFAGLLINTGINKDITLSAMTGRSRVIKLIFKWIVQRGLFYLSPYFYSYQTLMVNEMAGDVYEIKSNDDTFSVGGVKGEFVLDQLGFNPPRFRIYLVFNVVYYFIALVVCYLLVLLTSPTLYVKSLKSHGPKYADEGPYENHTPDSDQANKQPLQSQSSSKADDLSSAQSD